MLRTTKQRWATIALSLAVATAALPQDVGSRRGGADPPLPAAPDREAIADFIEVEGSVELRVAPTEARLVVAFAAEAADPKLCRAELDASVGAVTAALGAVGVPIADVRRDFIALTPVYTWAPEERAGTRVLAERRTAYRLTENLHVHVRQLGLVPAARAAALDSGAADLIAFDYGAEGLDAVRDKALREALAAAQRKADLLLGGAFGEARPTPINVREDVRMHSPSDLYETFTVNDGTTGYGYGGDVVRVPATRPATTYYRGFDQGVDVRGGGLALKPELSVVARVWLYYGAPGRERMVPGARD